MILARLILYVCISATQQDPHTFTAPETGVGHVAYSYSLPFFDLAREAANECEAAHGEVCETYCFMSRDGEE